MKIYVVGSLNDKFVPLDSIREKFFRDKKHNGDNIDYLNPWYCELTGLYHLWKHSDDDIVGLEHYRRNFVDDSGLLLGEQRILEILSSYDVIAHESNSDKSEYWYKCRQKKLPLLKKFLRVLDSSDDDDLVNVFKSYLSKDSYIQNNMFICCRKIFDEYCNWIFDRLDKFYQMSLCEDFLEARLIGYVAEYFFGAWLEYKRYKIYNCKQLHRGTIR